MFVVLRGVVVFVLFVGGITAPLQESPGMQPAAVGVYACPDAKNSVGNPHCDHWLWSLSHMPQVMSHRPAYGTLPLIVFCVPGKRTLSTAPIALQVMS